MPCKLHDLEIKKEKFNEILPSEWSVKKMRFGGLLLPGGDALVGP